MREADLETSLAAFHDLWARVHRVRSTSVTVTVPKAALVALLLDHTRLVNELTDTPAVGKSRWTVT